MTQECVVGCAVLLVLSLAAGVHGQEPAHPSSGFGTKVEVVACTVYLDVLDAKGKLVAGVSADMLRAFEDGVEVPILEFRPREAAKASRRKPRVTPVADQGGPAELPAPQRYVVIALDPVTLGRQAWDRALEDLAASAERLVSVGPVDVVALTTPPVTFVGATHDAAELRGALARIAAEVTPLDRFYTARLRLLDELQRASGGLPEWELIARGAAAEEEGELRETLGRLQQTMVGAGRPLVVVWAAQGDPDTFALIRSLFGDRLSNADKVRLMADPLATLRVLEGTWQKWAKDGITVVCWTRAPDDRLMAGTAESRNAYSGHPLQALGAQPFALFQAVAEDTGGALVRSRRDIQTALATVGGAFELVYQSDKADAGWRELRVEVAQPGWTVRMSPRQYVTAPPRTSVAPLPGPSATVLGVELAALSSPSERFGRDLVRLPIGVDLAPLRSRLPTGETAQFVFRIVATPPGGRAVGREVEVRAAKLPEDGVLRYETTLEVPHGTKDYAVEVREKTTGAYGRAGPVDAVETAFAHTVPPPVLRPGAFADSSEVRIGQARFLMPAGKAPEPESIKVLWKKREQRLVRVVGGAGSSLELGVAIDVSDSVRNERAAFVRAAADAAARLLAPDDRVFRVDFGATARYLGAVEGGPGALFASLPTWPPEKTALFDALLDALGRFEGRRDRGALIVLTDACETTGKADYKAVLRAARAQAIPVFAVIVDRTPCWKRNTLRVDTLDTDGTFEHHERTIETPSSASRSALASVAKESGGLALSLKRPEDAQQVWGEVEKVLGRLWVAVFEPTDPKVDGRRVEVRSTSGALLRPSG